MHLQSDPFVLSINCSPRSLGSCSAFIKQLSLTDLGLSFKSQLVIDSRINPCLGCNHCLPSICQCVHDDDMKHYIHLLDTATALILVSPLYFYTFPSHAKALIDRCHPLWHNAYWQERSRRPAFFVGTYDSEKSDGHEVMLKTAKAFFNTTGFKLVDSMFLSTKNLTSDTANDREFNSQCKIVIKKIHKMVRNSVK